jgi:hypothetical protein
MDHTPSIRTPIRRLFLGSNALALSAGAIALLDGQPVGARTLEEYAKALKVDQLKNEDDVPDLAAHLERTAASACLGVITAFKGPALGKIAARLAADEVGHFALLNFDLKRPLAKAWSYGA